MEVQFSAIDNDRPNDQPTNRPTDGHAGSHRNREVMTPKMNLDYIKETLTYSFFGLYPG